MCLVIGMHIFRESILKIWKWVCICLGGVLMFIWNQNLFFRLSVLSSSKRGRLLNQSWSLIDFDDTKIFLICLLIMLFSFSEMYLIPKAKTSLRVLKIQHLGDGFESLIDRIRISIPESEENWNKGGWFESLSNKKLQICTPTKKKIFVHVSDIFWLYLFLTKMKIKSKTF